MNTLRPVYAVHCALAAALVFSCGCRVSTHTRRKALLRARGKVLFVPFREGTEFHYDSEGGVVIAVSAATALKSNSSRSSAADSSEARGAVRTLVLAEEITPEDWAAVGAEVGADWVVYGEIIDTSWRDKMDQSIPRCNFTMKYAAVHVPRRRIALARTVSGTYPVRLVADDGVLVFDMSPDMLRFKSYAYMGTVVARTFYVYEISRLEERGLTESENTTR
ncbi:MAG: hypothetical protein ACYTAN_04645 [Planctomycetota bacterium]